MSSARIALVTGGNRGMGLEVCRALAARGHRVLLASRDLDKGRAAAQALSGDVQAVQLDVASPQSIEALAHELGERGVDVLVNNAGVLLDSRRAGTGSVFDMPLSNLEASMATNLYGPLLLAQKLVPGMVRRGYGRVVNVSTGMAQLASMEGGHAAYRLSKTALNALTRVLAAETASFDVLVNAVCPGWVRTAMGGPHAPRTPEQGAETIVWLCELPKGGPTGGFFRDEQPIPW